MIQIDRNNYESYFILYMDNELPAEDRKAVELFIEQHPDLKEELEILLQFKLEPDTSVRFDNKELLLRSANDELINSLNEEEWFMLYLDNELDHDNKLAVEKYISVHPSSFAVMHRLQQSKLIPEHLVFADKTSLYRREEKRRPVIPFWFRVAAAVFLFLIAGSLIYINQGKKSISTEPISKNTATEKNDDKEIKGNNAQQQELVKQQGVEQEKKEAVPIIIEEKQSSVHLSTTNRKETVRETPLDNMPEDEKTVIAATPRFTNQLPERVSNIPSTIQQDNSPEFTVPNSPLTNRSVTTASLHPSDGGSYNDDEDEVSSQGGKKNKLRGIFRKVTRTFEKRTNIDATDHNDRLLVAGLSIKLK